MKDGSFQEKQLVRKILINLILAALFLSGGLNFSLIKAQKQPKSSEKKEKQSKKPKSDADPFPPAMTNSKNLREIPYEGKLVPENPPMRVPTSQKPLENWVVSALDALYAAPGTPAPAAIPVSPAKAIYVQGKAPVIQLLPGPAFFSDKLSPIAKTALPEMTAFSNKIKVLKKGELKLVAFDRTQNDTALSQDSMEFEANFTDQQGNEWRIVQALLAPVSPDPVGEPWFGGLAIDQIYHGQTGNGTPLFPKINGALLSWGWADVWLNGKKIEAAVPLHIMVTNKTRGNADVNYKWLCYDCTDRPMGEVHIIIAPKADVGAHNMDLAKEIAPGGFLHIMWENAEIKRGTPEELANYAPALKLNIPTIEIDAVKYLSWDKKRVELETGKTYRLVVANKDPVTSFHAFMYHTPDGVFSFPIPYGSPWATIIKFDKPGEYKFGCPVMNHEERGMHGMFVVKGKGESQKQTAKKGGKSEK